MIIFSVVFKIERYIKREKRRESAIKRFHVFAIKRIRNSLKKKKKVGGRESIFKINEELSLVLFILLSLSVVRFFNKKRR